ncbi:MAG: hypothetical protein K2G18_02250 [Bacteroidales bacterium]|nr:hypothetical protein [Bacteroidales bacterium]
MKRLCSFVALTIFLSVVLMSCGKVYKDIDTIDTEEAACSIVLNDLISPSFRLIELAEVFSGYQNIRSDRERALDFVDGFFGTQYLVYYEFMDIGNWGRIELLDDGTFTAAPRYWRGHWIACSMDRTVKISVPREHCYSAAGTSGEAVYVFKAEVDGDTITMTELNVNYETEKYGVPKCAVKLEIVDSLEIPMCKNGKCKREPISGKIKIDYQSRYIKKTFQVEFHEYNKTIILPDGSSRSAEPERTFGGNEY